MIFFEEEAESGRGRNKHLVLVIYDITDNRKRNRMAKLLSAFGVRVQKSAFEAWLAPREYERLLSRLSRLIDEEVDCVRVYRLGGYTEIKNWGRVGETTDEDYLVL